MKKLLLFCLLGVLFITVDLVAVNSSPIHPTKDNLSKKEQKQQQRLQKKKAKWDKRMKKIEKKLAKKGIAKGNGVWDDDTFRLGALIALGGLVIRLFAFLPFIGGIFSLIGTLVFLVGLGVMIWVLIEN